MKRFTLGLITLCLAAALACGGDEETSQTCTSDHECQNDVCMCTTAGKSGTSCEKDSCEQQCQVCS